MSLLQLVPLEALWKDKTCVITFLRMFPWPWCRVHAQKLSTLRPQLDAANVRSVAVGHEDVGAEDFVKGKFFDGGGYIRIIDKKGLFADS